MPYSPFDSVFRRYRAGRPPDPQLPVKPVFFASSGESVGDLVVLALAFVFVVEAVGMWATLLRCPHVHSLESLLASRVPLFEKAKELSAGRVEGTLLIFGPVGDERSTFVV